jgi:hypothetical protein
MARPRVVSLNRKREERRRRERQCVKADLVHQSRQQPDDIDGYALLVFRHEKSGALYSAVRYYVRAPADTYILPELTRERFAKEIHRWWNTDDDDDVPEDDPA